MPQPMPQTMPINPHATLTFNKGDEAEIRLRRIAVEIVSALPPDLASASTVLRYAGELLAWVQK